MPKGAAAPDIGTLQRGYCPSPCRRLSNGESGRVLEGLGGRTRARTWDPMIKSHLLYQLSYAPGTWSGKPPQEGVV